MTKQVHSGGKERALLGSTYLSLYACADKWWDSHPSRPLTWEEDDPGQWLLEWRGLFSQLLRGCLDHPQRPPLGYLESCYPALVRGVRSVRVNFTTLSASAWISSCDIGGACVCCPIDDATAGFCGCQPTQKCGPAAVH